MNPVEGSTVRADLHAIADRAADFVESLPARPTCLPRTEAELLQRMDRPFPEHASPARTVIEELVEDVGPGLAANAGPRYFGFVMGGATPASLMADWLTSAWNQNAQVYTTSPAAATIEGIVAGWLLELFGLPAHASVGFVTGCQMAHFTALMCARNAVLERTGWDFDRLGTSGAPPVSVFMSEDSHGSVRTALRMLGVGTAHIHEIPADPEGRLCLPTLEAELRHAQGRPMVLCLQAGNVNSGAFETWWAMRTPGST